MFDQLDLKNNFFSNLSYLRKNFFRINTNNTERLRKKLNKSKSNEVADVFIEYCDALIKNYEAKKIPLQEVGMKIIDATRNELDAVGELTPVMAITDEILELGGNLEMYPLDKSAGVDAQKDLNRIKELIAQFNTLKTKKH